MTTISLTRFLAKFRRAAQPVDGGTQPDENVPVHTADHPSPQLRDEILRRAESEPHEPLRWGNFR